VDRHDFTTRRFMHSSGPPHAPTTLTVDLDAIAANWRFLRDRTAHRKATAVIKADGYGLGVGPVARTLAAAGCETFFVAHLDEAITALRHFPADARPRFVVLNGLHDPRDAPVYAEHGVLPTLNDLGQVAAWRDVCRARGGALPALLHVDTGMSRLGLDRGETERLIADPGLLDGIDLRFVMSHVACADTPDHPMNPAQRDRFADIVARLPRAAEGAMLAASSASFLGADYHFDAIRPGVAIFGGRPNTAAPNPLKPVVTLASRILQVRRIDRPETVGYGATHGVEGPTQIATIAVGYADGFLRALSQKARARVGGLDVPVVGRISMDLITIDVTTVPNVQAGDVATLIDADRTIDDVADAAGTIGYEILTGLGSRYARRYVGGAA
jgi:alanine racemase